MSDPTKQDIGWGRVLKINLQYAFGTLIIFIGWLCWRGVSLKWWGLSLMAVICFAGGAIQVIQATVEAVQMILKLRRWKRYERLGSRPRADHMAQDHDFTDGGFGR